MFGLKILAHLYLFFTRVFSRVQRCGTLAFFVWGSQTMLTRPFKYASFGPPPNLDKCISLVEVNRFGQCLGYLFLSMSIFVSPACFCAFKHAPHSRFRCRDPTLCLPNFLKMLLLVLPQICTRVFHLWKTIDWHSVWFEVSRPYQLSFLS